MKKNDLTIGQCLLVTAASAILLVMLLLLVADQIIDQGQTIGNKIYEQNNPN